MNASASPPSSACVPSPWWTSTSTTSTRRTRRRARRSRIAVTTSLKTQNPRPTWANAWCVPPPRFSATPSASAARDASSVAPVARRERSTSSGDHGRPSPSSSRRSSRPSRTRSTQSAVVRPQQLLPRGRRSRRHLHVREPLRALPHEPVLREREPVAVGERVRVDVVGEGAHGPTVACGAPSRPRRGLRDRIARWPGGSRASRRSCWGSRTGARSPGRSRSASPPRARSSRSPTRASASRSPCATWPRRSTRSSSRRATSAPTTTSTASSRRPPRRSAAGSTCSCTRSRSPRPRTSRDGSPTRRATASGWRSTSARTPSSRARGGRSR